MAILTNNNIAHLRLFNDGLQLDVCLELGNAFGRLFPSLPQGTIIKEGSIRDLNAKGLIRETRIFPNGLEYKRFSITDLGKKTFEEYKHDTSK